MNFFKKISGKLLFVIFISLLILGTARFLTNREVVAQTVVDPVAEINSLNQILLAKNTDYNTAGVPSLQKADDLSLMKTVSLDRRAKLKLLMSINPAKTAQVLITNTSDYPAEVQANLEKKVTETGLYRVMHLDTQPVSLDHFYLYKNGGYSQKVELYPENSQINTSWQGKNLSVYGWEIDDLVWFSFENNKSLGGLAPTSQALTPAIANTASTTGVRTLNVFYVNFTDRTQRDLTNAQIQDQIFNKYQAFLNRSSNSKLTLIGAVHQISLNIKFTCDINALITETDTRAREAYISPDDATDNLIFTDAYFDSPNFCPFGGQSFGQSGWFLTFGFRTFSHEFGHNLGLAHANSLSCGNTMIDSNYANCGPGQPKQYGNIYDIMGGSYSPHIDTMEYGGYAKEFMKWLDPNEVADGTGGGTYTIYALENHAPAGAVNPYRVLKVNTFMGGPDYYIQYRQVEQPNGPDLELASGTLGPGRTTMLLDTTPNSSSISENFRDGYIHDGQTINDAYNGIVIKGISHDATSATVQIIRGSRGAQSSGLNLTFNRPTGYVLATGQKKDISWNPIHYVIDVKCTGGYGCSGNWNQWSGCATWPTGSCPPFDTTGTSVDIPVGSTGIGYSYQYRVWLLTRDDNNPNQAATYEWIAESDTSSNCGGASNCTVKITWPTATYKAYLYKNTDGTSACNYNPGCTDFIYLQDATKVTFRGLPTGINFNSKIKVTDFNNINHLLTYNTDEGQAVAYNGINDTGHCQSNSSKRSCAIPSLAFNGGEAISWTAYLNNSNGVVISGPYTTFANSSGGFSDDFWSWNLVLAAYPVNDVHNFTNCYVAGTYCLIQNYYDPLFPVTTTFGGAIPLTTYRVTVCAVSCNPPSGGNPAVATGDVYSAAGPSFFETDPFLQGSVVVDTDKDGFSDLVESYIGTNPNLACGVNAWPPDIDNDGAVSILDLAKMATAYGSSVGQTNYNRRYDLDADGTISILDLSKAASYFGRKCTVPIATATSASVSANQTSAPVKLNPSPVTASPSPSVAPSASPGLSPVASPSPQATSSAH